MQIIEFIKNLLKPQGNTYNDWHDFTAACKTIYEAQNKPTVKEPKDKQPNTESKMESTF